MLLTRGGLNAPFEGERDVTHRKSQRLIDLFGCRSLCFYAAKLMRLPHTQGQATLLLKILQPFG